MKMHFSIMTLIIFSLLSGCAKNPATGENDFVMMTENEELAIGKQVFAQMSKSLILLPETDPLHQYIDRIGQKVAATADRQDLFYRFYVVDDENINAFALPGGFIFMHRGLINHMNSEAELAAVLGHEIGHVTARHSVKQISKARAYQNTMMIASIFVPIPQGAGMLTNLMASAVISGYGRDAELQSDELSIRYLTNAGYDPNATIGILKTLQRLDEIDTREKTDAGEKVEKYHGAFSTHPETKKRIEESIALADSKQKKKGTVNREPFLKEVKGYAYGDSAEQGAVVGKRFIHPELKFQISFPDEWIITNSAQSVNARIRKEEIFFRFTLEELQKKKNAEEIIKGLFTDRHIQQITVEEKAGMQYAHARIQQSAPHVSKAMIDSHVFLKGRKAYVLSMWCHRDEFDKYSAQFKEIADSFSDYDIERDGDIPRIALHRWKKGDSWQALAKQSDNIIGNFTADRFAALNGMNPDEIPEAGKVVKIVK